MGLNVNQIKFPSEIPSVTSLKKLTGKDFDIDALLVAIVNSIKNEVKKVEQKQYKSLKKEYLNNLYRFYVPAMFVAGDEPAFLGKIIDVNHAGQLVVEDAQEKVCKFNLKEIKFADQLG